MSLNTLNRFPVDNLSINLSSIQLAFLVMGLVEFLLLHIFLDRKRNYRFFSGFSSLFIAPDNSRDQPAMEKHVELSTKNEKRVVQIVRGVDMELVLRGLGMFEAALPAKLDSDELFNLFEEENPRLEEVQEAFDVFDKNRDGFIDANELQSVLCALALNEGSDIENCRKMIGLFDKNGDGRIDFDEFVKFMESSSLC